jgi:hypothetical protein
MSRLIKPLPIDGIDDFMIIRYNNVNTKPSIYTQRCFRPVRSGWTGCSGPSVWIYADGVDC